MGLEAAAVLRFKAIVESDPGALVRVLQVLQMRNIVPRHVIAQRVGSDYLEIEIAINAADLDRDAFRVIIAKIDQLPLVLVVVHCD